MRNFFVFLKWERNVEGALMILKIEWKWDRLAIDFEGEKYCDRWKKKHENLFWQLKKDLNWNLKKKPLKFIANILKHCKFTWGLNSDNFINL